jgi:hypothetical protein
MEVHPEMQKYSESFPMEENTKRVEEALADPEVILAQGSQEALQKMQDKLRKAGWKKMK